MSLCLNAFKTHEPAKYSEMREIFEQHKVNYDSMCQTPKEVINDPNLVVQIEK